MGDRETRRKENERRCGTDWVLRLWGESVTRSKKIGRFAYGKLPNAESLLATRRSVLALASTLLSLTRIHDYHRRLDN